MREGTWTRCNVVSHLCAFHLIRVTESSRPPVFTFRAESTAHKLGHTKNPKQPNISVSQLHLQLIVFCPKGLFNELLGARALLKPSYSTLMPPHFLSRPWALHLWSKLPTTQASCGCTNLKMHLVCCTRQKPLPAYNGKIKALQTNSPSVENGFETIHVVLATCT